MQRTSDKRRRALSLLDDVQDHHALCSDLLFLVAIIQHVGGIDIFHDVCRSASTSAWISSLNRMPPKVNSCSTRILILLGLNSDPTSYYPPLQFDPEHPDTHPLAGSNHSELTVPSPTTLRYPVSAP